VIVLSADEVANLLDPDALVDALDAAMRDLSAGSCSVPPRVAATVEHGMLLAMPAFLPSAGLLSAKLVTQFPRNTDRPAHQALVCCFDPDDGTPLAVMDGEYLTTARTAAGAVLAARYLAGTGPVAVVGTGTLARAHVAAFRRAGRDTVLVAGRNADRAAAFAADTGAEPAASIEAAVRAAAVVCTCTHAAAPVVRREWLRDGAHVSSVESRDAALAAAPAGAPELIAAMAAGVLTPDDVREVGELAGDEQRNRLTVYKSVGVGVQDAAAAALVLRAAARS
jgi:ornithine cyclodeaminase